MTSRGRAAAACGLCAVSLLAGCGGASSAPVKGGGNGVCGGQTGVASGRTASYVVVLLVDALSSAAGTAATPAVSPTPTTPAGDTVISGSLADVSGSGADHLEIYICNRSTGGIAGGLHPMVTLRNDSSGASPATMPVAVLERAGEGVTGLHYGNNVTMESGANYTISVRIDSSNAIDLAYQVPNATAVVTPGLPPCLLNHQMCE